jgi:acetyltransferase-like isoleucine patch superfamily enzyme
LPEAFPEAYLSPESKEDGQGMAVIAREGYTLHIGAYTFVNGTPRVFSFGEMGRALRVGKFCSIANGLTILLGGEHRTDWITTYPFHESMEHPNPKGDVTIGNDVWIGLDATILSGVNVGDGAVIGARSVVTRDVKPYSIVAGNPAKHIRFRFDNYTRALLQKISWWDWPLPKIKEAWPLLLSPNVAAFIKKYGQDFVSAEDDEIIKDMKA